jgi:cation-transporting ATPase G
VRTVTLDKTGTLTRNRPAVVDVVTANGSDCDEILGVAAALEARSEHPLAAAILAAQPAAGAGVAVDVQAISGHGLTGIIDGKAGRLGKPGFIDPGPLNPNRAAAATRGKHRRARRA